MERKRYGAIDGLRTIACIGIVMMHMKTNNSYIINGFVYEKLISSFTNFVFLFMVISAFGMCCGYLERVLNNQISMETFYKKRYGKILPFFSCLVLLDIVISPSKAAICEGVADVTLLFGLFPNNISVIGVAWFLGVIFAFYLLFPFYCVLLKNKRRAWGAFIIALILNYIGESYFGLDRRNIVYCLCYLLAGGLVYLHRNELEEFSRKYPWGALGIVAAAVVAYFVVGANTMTMLVAVAMLILALGRLGGVLENQFTIFFSSISMGIYLSHMAVFRLVEKLHLNKAISNDILQYIITVLVTLIGTVVFLMILKKVLGLIKNRIGGLF